MTPRRLLLLSLVSLTLAACAPRTFAPRREPEGIRFRVPAPDARKVSLLASFLEWESLPLTRAGGRDVWTVVVRVPPGRHLYAYRVDGVLVTPPEALRTAPDEFGGRNAILHVPGDLGDGS